MINIGRHIASFGKHLLTPSQYGPLSTRIHYSFAGTPLVISEKVFPLPEIADSITEGTIADYTKAVGDWVELD